jgi:hypothetical protein
MLQESTSLLLFLMFALSLAWLIVLTFLFWQQKRFLVQFTSGVTKKDLKSLLDHIAHSLKEVGGEIDGLHHEVKNIKVDNLSHLQKIGFIRYNPFADTGGDQSFCLCLLDKYNNGIVITSLHSREQTRIYAKAVVKGKSENMEFAKEEADAVDAAIKKGTKRKE